MKINFDSIFEETAPHSQINKESSSFLDEHRDLNKILKTSSTANILEQGNSILTFNTTRDSQQNQTNLLKTMIESSRRIISQEKLASNRSIEKTKRIKEKNKQ